MQIRIVYLSPNKQIDRCFDFPAGTLLGDALGQSGIDQQLLSEGVESAITCAVFGRLVDRQYALREGDRIEILRPLKAESIRTRYSHT